MNLIGYVVGLLLTCPHIKVDTVHVDGVDADPESYSVESLPANPVLKAYLNGDAQKQYLFALTSRKHTFTDEEKAANSALYEQVSLWMEDMTRCRRLPDMGPGRRAMHLAALESGYPIEQADDNNSGLYVMQCRLTYYEKGRQQPCS